MTLELIAILALGIPLLVLLLTFRDDARADYQALRTELRAEIQNLRAESRAENHALRAEIRASDQRLRKDVQSLAKRTARLESAIQALVAVRDDRDRHDDAA